MLKNLPIASYLIQTKNQDSDLSSKGSRTLPKAVFLFCSVVVAVKRQPRHGLHFPSALAFKGTIVII